MGGITDGESRLSHCGEIVREEWVKTASVRPYVVLDEYVVMPNHVHGIILIIHDDVGATRRVAPTTGHADPTGPESGSIGAMIGQFKSNASKRINALRGTSGAPVWQRNYYEHIIRNDLDMERIREYIVMNPLKWETDHENPLNEYHSV